MSLETSNLQEFQRELLKDLSAFKKSLLVAIDTFPTSVATGEPSDSEKIKRL
jgi:hypothetical protein